MVEHKNETLNDVFGALSDPTRRSILEQLRDGRATVSELAGPHEITIQGVSKHLKKLEAAGLIRRTKDGREVWCELLIEPMQQASSWLDEQRRFWEVRLDQLERLFKERDEENDRKQVNQQKKRGNDGNEID